MPLRKSALLVAVAASLFLASCSSNATQAASEKSPDAGASDSSGPPASDSVYDLNGEAFPFERLIADHCDFTAPQVEQMNCVVETVGAGRLASFDGSYDRSVGLVNGKQQVAFENDGELVEFPVFCPLDLTACHTLKKGDPVHVVVKTFVVEAPPSRGIGYDAVSIEVR